MGMISFYRVLRELLLVVLLVGCPGAGGKDEQSEYERHRRRLAPTPGERVLPDFGVDPSQGSAVTAEFWQPAARGEGSTWSPDWRPGSPRTMRTQFPAP